MSDRTYRTLLGLVLLVGLYFELPGLIYGLVVMLFVEGITNYRIPIIFCKFRKCVASARNPLEYQPEPSNPKYRFNCDSERIWRLVVGLFLLISYYFYDQLWFFPWFMGFAIFGAGLSGVCPVLLAIRWVGFK